MTNVDDGVKPARLRESRHSWDATVYSHWALYGNNVEEAAKDSSCSTAKLSHQITLGGGETLSAPPFPCRHQSTNSSGLWIFA
eukprot:3055487-Pleurochrysis_carterae.AAC.1